MFTIYSLSGPDGITRYIGASTKDSAYILSHHRSAAKSAKRRTPVNEWVLESNGSVTYTALESVSAEDKDARVEFWIANARRQGLPILNVSKAEHAAKVRKAMNDPEVKSRMIENRPKTYKKPEGWVSRKGQTGRHISEEHKAAISRAHKGKFVSEETRAKIAEKALGHKRNAGRVQSEETRLKMSHSKHLNTHVAADLVKQGCRWCAGDTLGLDK